MECAADGPKEVYLVRARVDDAGDFMEEAGGSNIPESTAPGFLSCHESPLGALGHGFVDAEFEAASIADAHAQFVAICDHLEQRYSRVIVAKT